MDIKKQGKVAAAEKKVAAAAAEKQKKVAAAAAADENAAAKEQIKVIGEKRPAVAASDGSGLNARQTT